MAVLLPSVALAAGQKVVFVDASASAGGSGLSWATAFQSLQQGLAAASALEKPVQVWVASGVYTPFDGSTNRALSFKLENGVAIYGGFNGTETDLSQRFPGEYSTILSGDRLGNDTLGTFGNYTENAYHVVTGVGVDNSAILDGVYVHSGNANGSGTQANGGGIYLKSGAAPTLTGCRFNYNFGERYLFTFTMRADGSSKFGPENRWGYFPSGLIGILLIIVLVLALTGRLAW